MKKIALTSIAALAAAGAVAQSPIDALQITQADFKGTARYMSMGGAFTALGGDLSAINVNPAGVGIYRRSEVGATLALDFQNSTTPRASLSNGANFPNKMSQTKATCTNFGYVGSFTNISFGVTYNRATSFDRVYTGYISPSPSSLSDYVAAYTTVAPQDLDFGSNYNPYFDGGDVDWLSILAYSGYLISPVGVEGDNTIYTGLSGPNTVSDALFNVREEGYVDEYNLTFGGNINDVVYLGANVGINDLQYHRFAYYDESLANAIVPETTTADYLVDGNAGFSLDNFKYIKGTGWNLKLGVIVKPINELRFGISVQTPTWYTLTQGYEANIDYNYAPNTAPAFSGSDYTGDEYDTQAWFQWRFASPWKLNFGVAGVIGSTAIISADYQFEGYNSMKMSLPIYDYSGFITGYASDQWLNERISNYYQGASTLRVGAEFRVTPQLSLRAGYNVRFTNISKAVSSGQMEVATSGTDPSYSLDKTVQHLCLGIGYKYKAWYIDAAYVYKHRESTYHAYTNWYDNEGLRLAPSCELTNNDSQVILSTGFKF